MTTHEPQTHPVALTVDVLKASEIAFVINEQRQFLLDDPTLIPDAVEEALRMYPAFAHFGRTATVESAPTTYAKVPCGPC